MRGAATLIRLPSSPLTGQPKTNTQLMQPAQYKLHHRHHSLIMTIIMEHVLYKQHTARKRRRASSLSSTPEVGDGRKRRQPASTPPEPLSSEHQHNAQAQAQAQELWAERAHSISTWVCGIPESPCDPSRSVRSESLSLRDRKTQQRRMRSTKKSPQYRNTVLKLANILVDVVHRLPPEIEALLPGHLRAVLDPLPAAHLPAQSDSTIATSGGNTEERDGGTKELIVQLAAVYRDECRELAGKPGSEPEYRTHLYGDVVEKLARNPLWRSVLRTNCSDKLWHASLKPSPPNPILSLPSTWLPLPPNYIAVKPLRDASFESTQNLVDSSIHPRPDSNTFNFTVPPSSIEPSESSTTSELESTLTTPKPDITIGISWDAFSLSHISLLNYWQANRAVLSDPHATQGDMRFPFLIVEAKGLTTNGNLIGAQNQAAGGGTCAIRVLESLAAQDPGANAPRIVFSVTTEGAMHEIWVHYRIADQDNVQKYYMTCLGAWRTTLDRHASEFVAVLASILRWGVDVFHPQIKQVLDRVLNAAAVVIQ